MYQIGDYVVKASCGLCRIENIQHLDMAGATKDRLYYLLVPVSDEKSKVYVPVDGEASTLRKVLKPEEAWEMIERIPEIEEVPVVNEKQREQSYKEAVKSCRPEAWVSLLKRIYARREKRYAQGKKNTAIDDHYFKIAEEYLYSELAFAIGRPKSEMTQIIADVLEDLSKR